MYHVHAIAYEYDDPREQVVEILGSFESREEAEALKSKLESQDWETSFGDIYFVIKEPMNVASWLVSVPGYGMDEPEIVEAFPIAKEFLS